MQACINIIYCRQSIDICQLTEVPTDSTIGTARPRLKTDMSRSRTHNEQTLVRACGVMLGHAAFYNAEAVSNVLVRLPDS